MPRTAAPLRDARIRTCARRQREGEAGAWPAMLAGMVARPERSLPERGTWVHTRRVVTAKEGDERARGDAARAQK